MKKSALLSIGILVVSCTAIKQISNEKIIAKRGCQALDTRNGIPVMRMFVDDSEHDFLFDTGAPFSTINDTLIINNFHGKAIGSIGKIKGGDNKGGIAKRNFTVSAKNDLFESDNKIMALTNMPISKCATGFTSKGIIGLDFFFNGPEPVLINFTDGKICNLDKTDLQNHLSNKAFREVESQCRLNTVFIFLTIAGKKHKFVFDTGYSGHLILPQSKNINLSTYNSMQLQGSYFSTVTALTNGIETFYEKVSIDFEGRKIDTKVILSETVAHKLAGLQFLKGFDWIIDYKNNKVYAKRNHLKIEETFNRKVSYYARADEKLTIVVKEKNQTKYNLGDEIVSVNGTQVTPENNCELQSLLNRTEDWNTLNLEVIQTTK